MRDNGPDRPAKARRRWTAAEKIRLVEHACRPGRSLSRVARRYGVAYHLLRRWRRLVQDGVLVNGGVRCTLCNAPFEAARPDARFCSARCRQRAHRLRKAARGTQGAGERRTPG